MTSELEPVWKQFAETYDALREALAEVPDDRLAWKACPTATSALAIVAHVVRANRRYSSLAAGAGLPTAPAEEIPGRERMLELLRDSQDQVREVFERLSPEELQRPCASDWSPLGPEVQGPLDALWFCHQIVRHTAYHLGQINYISLLLEGSGPDRPLTAPRSGSPE
jgi:uncharacterized damage-inducible protein DinB